MNQTLASGSKLALCAELVLLMSTVVVMACWPTDGDITDSCIEVTVSMNQTLAWGSKLALWAGVVDVNSGADGMLLNDGNIIGSSIAEVIVPVWVLGMVAEVMPVPQQCPAAIKYPNTSPVA